MPAAVVSCDDITSNSSLTEATANSPVIKSTNEHQCNGDEKLGKVSDISALCRNKVAEEKELKEDVKTSISNGCINEKLNGEIEMDDSNSEKQNGDLDETNSAQKTKSKSTEATDELDYPYLHDTGFTVTIASPGLDPFDVQVSSMELVQEIHQLLMDREETCHRTCFSLQLDGVSMDNFAELKNIESLKEGSVIKVVEEPYTIREARIHLRHVRDLLKSVDMADACNGVDCNSLTFLNVITQGDLLVEKKKLRSESVDCTPPDHILPNCRDRPLLPLQPQAKEQKQISLALKVLTASGWNPPPGHRKLHGDLMYLYVVTLEDKHLHITASSRGFYINQSTEEEFNPKPANPKVVYHALIDLLSQVSALFKRNFALIQKRRVQRHAFERVATPYQVYTWLAPSFEHTIDSIRAEDAFSSKLGYEEHIPGQTRDWNEELQTTRELPRKTLLERILRERAIFKVHSDFVGAATRGAVAVIDGNVMAINPGDETKMQMFIWNNIFFSLGFDVRDHYKELGGDAAAFAAPCNDLQGVRAYNAVDIEGLYTLGTVVIDYRGYRVTAQSIIPGILEREQEQAVVYGSVDFGKTVVSHTKYLDLLSKAGQQLKVLPHKVVNESKEEIELCSSVECKGIIGNDGRHYILDLLRTFPPDVNFLPIEGEELSKEAQRLGFPRKHKHKLCCLRQELVEAFVEAKYLLFIKLAAYHLQRMKGQAKETEKEIDAENKMLTDAEENLKEKLNESEIFGKDSNKLELNDAKESNQETELKEGKEVNEGTEIILSDNVRLPKTDKAETDEYKKILETYTNGEKSEVVDSTKDIIRKAARAVGSLKDTEFDIRFNPDVYSYGVTHPNSLSDAFQRQRLLVKNAADFLLTVQIPGLVRDCLEHTASPIDGLTLTEALHNRGINIRYLGKIADMVAKIPQLQYFHTLAVSEILCRSAKHLFMAYLQGVETVLHASAISHFLNCLLSSATSLPPPVASEELHLKSSKRKGKKRNKQNPFSTQETEWALLTPASLWQSLKEELDSYYGFTLEADSIDSAVELYAFQKISLLRSCCLKMGVQLILREYNLEHKLNRVAFTEDDILNVFPVVKHINPRATDACNFYSTGQIKIQQGFLKEGYELISEALNLLNNVYGAMHPEVAQCLRMLARLTYIMGDHVEALAYQQRAVLMSERVNGIDHPSTITEYTHLALYSFANSQISTSLKLLYRARYLAMLICGENHPEMAVLNSNIGLILHAVGEYDLSLRFLESALKLQIKYFGSKSLKVAVSYHLVARTQSCMGDFRGALQNEKETYAIYKQQFGEEHEKTKESSECLKHLTQQAVALQKTMNEIFKGTPGATLPPIQIQSPSMTSVLDMLNVINGILFVTMSQQDIEDLKAEVERRQQQSENDSGDKESKTAEENEISSDVVIIPVVNESSNSSGR